jgi:hypothetical protein
LTQADHAVWGGDESGGGRGLSTWQAGEPKADGQSGGSEGSGEAGAQIHIRHGDSLVDVSLSLMVKAEISAQNQADCRPDVALNPDQM